jgi:uncharacterized protein (TIGR03437 family)
MKGISVSALPLIVAAVLAAQDYTITTFAGGVPPATPVRAVQASIGGPWGGVVADSRGNMYFTSLNCVFKIDTNGMMARVAGNSRAGYSGDGGPATGAQLNGHLGIAVDASGNLFIADSGNNRIRKVSPAGIITTIAGGGSDLGDGGPATSAQISGGLGIAVDVSGNLFIADGSSRIRKVSPTGIITTIAGNGSPGYSGDGGLATSAQLNDLGGGVAVDASGDVYIADYWNGRIRKVSPTGNITTVVGPGSFGSLGDGGPATSAQLYDPTDVAVDASGNLFIADSSHNRIRKVTPSGIITTIAGNGSFGYGGDGGPATSAQLAGPNAIAVDASGNLFIADTYNDRIRRVTPVGIITTIAGNGSVCSGGDGGPATSAQLCNPRGVAVDTSGNLFITDTASDRIREVSTAGMISTVAGVGPSGPYYFDGPFYPFNGGYFGDGGPAITAGLNGPSGVAVDASGNLFVADTDNNRIRKVSPTGRIVTVAGIGPTSPFPFSIMGRCSPIDGGYSGDGGPAVGAEFDGPVAVAVDTSGNLFIADSCNNRIRRVSPSGIISTVVGNGSMDYSGDGGPATSAQLSSGSVSVDTSGNIFIADTANHRIRKVTPTGIISTVAGDGALGYSGDGGPATSAQFLYPTQVAVDASGSLFIADSGPNVIRKVSPSGIITTIAGNGSAGYSGDGGPATSAQLNGPFGVAVDAFGRVFIGDFYNSAVRLLTPDVASCFYSLSSTSFNPPASGGNESLTVRTDSACSWTISNLPDWITVSGASSGSGGATLTLAVAINSGPPRSSEILVAGIPVTVIQASSLVLVSPGGVVSAASYRQPVALGSIIAIFGNFLLPAPVEASLPIPTMLGGLSFQYGALLIPLFYANSDQANGQVPWELAGQTQASIRATINGQTSAPQTVTLATYAPGLFAMNGQGTGQGAIVDLNGHLVDWANPAVPGNYVQIYGTGLGSVTNQPQTGAPAPSSPLAETMAMPRVMIGGAPAEVQFSGLAPGFVGLYQINAKVPDGVTSGLAVPVVLTIGGVQSNTVTIAVQ